MRWVETTSRIRADLARHAGRGGVRAFMRHYARSPGFRFMVLWRLCGYLRARAWGRLTLAPPLALALGHYTYKYGISIPLEVEIGGGFYIGHFGGIVINEHVTIGENCSLYQGVTIGRHNRGDRKGCPRIGNRVYLAPGCKVFGGIAIGDNAAVGANAVVTHDVPANAVVVGVSARIISFKGTEGYIRV